MVGGVKKFVGVVVLDFVFREGMVLDMDFVNGVVEVVVIRKGR